MIKIEAVWLAVEPLDMRAGTEAALARVVHVFGSARPHHAYLFANRRANRMKVLVHDGIGVWLAARRLHQGKFVWPKECSGTLSLTRAQLDALVLGLPWQRIALEVLVDRLEDVLGQVIGFQQVAEVEDGGLVGDRLAQAQVGEGAQPSYSASSIAGSLSANQFCIRCARSIDASR